MHLTQLHRDLGVTSTPAGPRLRVWSAHATALELCLFDEDAEVTSRAPLTPLGRGVWELTHPQLEPGQRYALRAEGPEGPHHAYGEHLLLDPYARGVASVQHPGEDDPRWFGVVVAQERFDWGGVDRPRHRLEDVVVYEAHVRGLTRLAGFLPPELRGTYAGLANPRTIDHLLRLGVNAVELLPVQAFASERFLRRRGLGNYWGYNTLAFFAPHAPYASAAARAAGQEAVIREFRGMVRNLHEAGIELYLDVVYNHTAEEGRQGQTTGFRGLDNEAYYRQDGQGEYIDVTGTGNSLNTSHAAVQQLILDSLIHWVEEFRIDGFRFDLATTLARNGGAEYDPDHPLLRAIVGEPRLAGAKLIAEPWDVGFGGWQTGNFPPGWAEWNDRYRDRMRSFWLQDIAHARHSGLHPTGIGPIATALAGSSNLYDDRRGPIASVNFVTAHDGFTLRDLVSYNVKHNLLNGELGRDGTTNNHSYNFGYEGPSEHPRIEADRRQAMRNLLGSLLLSSGVPMLTAGDEVARSQRGNNNPYNQDNEINWLDWEWDADAARQRDHVARLLEIRRSHPALRPRRFNHGQDLVEGGTRKEWFDALGTPMPESAWNAPETRTLQYLATTIVPIGEPDARPVTAGLAPSAVVPHVLDLAGEPVPAGYALDSVLIIVHGSEDPTLVQLPDTGRIASYSLLWDSAAEQVEQVWQDAESSTAGPRMTLRVPGPSLRIYRANPR